MDKREIIAILAPTSLYWAWESVAAGNIRIDLLLIYPVLFTIYLAGLWPRRKWRAVPVAIGIMAINVLYAIASYPLFDKYPG